MAVSITERMADAIVETIKAMSLTGNVVKRKRPALLDGERPPLICVCVAEREEFECLGSSGEKGKLLWLVTRQLAIGIGFASGGKVSENADLRRYRDAIWSGVSAITLQSRLAEINDVKPAGKPMFDAAAFANSTVDWSMIDLAVETLEVRNA